MPHEGLERLELRRSDDELASYVADLYRKKAEYFVLELASRERLAVGYTSGEKWLDVVTRKRRRGERGGVFTGPYESFGYNCDAGRWSYGEDPPGAGEIRALLAKHFGAKESGRWS